MTAVDDSEWWMFSYKVSPCPIQERHDWSTCPNAHRGERAARRCPRTYSYTPEPCPDYNKTGACAHGMNCPLAHSVFESWLHPSRFRTQLCCFGASCKRRICFFAHHPSQLRVATHTPNSAAAAVAAAAAGGPVMRRTQAVVPASMMSPQAGSSAAAAAAAAGMSAMRAASPAMLVTSAALQVSPQTGVPSWMYTGTGWVQAGAGMGQPMMMGMPGMPSSMQQQQQMLPGSVVPVDQAVFAGLAAGLSGLALQDGSDLVSSGHGVPSSCQGLACVPAMLPTSPNSALLYHSGSGAYARQGANMAAAAAAQGNAALMYGQAQGGAGTSMQQQGQGQQQWPQ